MSITAAREALVASMKKNPKVLQNPEPSVTVNKINQDGVELAVRPWCHPDEYWDVYFGVYEEGRNALMAAGIKGPQHQIQLQNILTPTD